MTKITKEEVLKIAAISNLNLYEDEIGPMIKQLGDVLSYAERVQEIAAELEEPSNRQVNVFREDMVVRTNSELVLREAPEREQAYFVVPKIIESA